MAPYAHPRRAPLSWGDRLLLAEALLTLGVASLAIRLLPFRRVVGAAGAADRRGAATDSAGETARKVAWAVSAWARRVPWKAVCFQQGLSVHVMLRRRGIASHLHYGVSQADGLKAHVWVSAAGRDVIGGEEAAGFTCLATYPPLPA
jgi:Transglutaminase-like superfamily